MTIKKRVGTGGSLLVEAVEHSHGVPGEAAIGEKMYGPYHNQVDIDAALAGIERSLPHGNKILIKEIGGRQRSWEITGEPHRVVPRRDQMQAH